MTKSRNWRAKSKRFRSPQDGWDTSSIPRPYLSRLMSPHLTSPHLASFCFHFHFLTLFRLNVRPQQSRRYLSTIRLLVSLATIAVMKDLSSFRLCLLFWLLLMGLPLGKPYTYLCPHRFILWGPTIQVVELRSGIKTKESKKDRERRLDLPLWQNPKIVEKSK